MTKFQKQMLTIAAAGALTAVTALPAMAFENEFHGMYQFKTFFSNFDNSTSGTINVTKNRDKVKMNNYMDQRARVQYIAKASDDLKLVTHFEMNSKFGDSVGGDLDTDGLNVLTKHAYIDFNIGKSFNTKIGLMPYKDTLKGVFLDADVPAVFTTTKLGAYSLGLGFVRTKDTNIDNAKTTTTDRLGDLDTDLFIMDNTFTFSKDTKAAFSYYFLADYKTAKQEAYVHTLGLSGETKFGALALSGFAAMQAGHQKGLTGKNTHFHGYALNAAAKMAMGPGSLRAAGLFLSGSNGSIQDGGWKGVGVTSYNEGMTMLIARNTALGGTGTDDFLYGKDKLTNLALLSMGYDANLSEKLFLNSTVAFAWAPKSYGAPKDAKTGTNASDFVGTELNTELGYKLYKNLTLKAQAAYMILGGYYKGAAANSTAAAVKDPENPYTMRLQATYTF